MSDQVLASVADDLDEARARLAHTRGVLERVLQGNDEPRLREAVARLERMEAELEHLAEARAEVAAT